MDIIKYSEYLSDIQDARQKLMLMPRHLNMQKQNKHIVGTSEYIQYQQTLSQRGMYGPSIITLNPAQLNQFIEESIGKGTPIIDEAGSWLHKERINAGFAIGITYNKDGFPQITTRAIIHYGKTGIHIVPAKS